VRTCVIFNRKAKGGKARRFRQRLRTMSAECTLKFTVSAGDARRLAANAIQEGFEVVVAAGGDGTLNEVLNGFGDVPDGFERTRLGVLPIGTINVFAREVNIPRKLDRAWAVICEGRETVIDLPSVEYQNNGTTQRRYFAQLAGAGLDARAIELVHWRLKQAVGGVAYFIAVLEALMRTQSRITVTGGGHSATGGLVLLGNGRFYGGTLHVFPDANLRDGLLEVCVLPRVSFFTLALCGISLLFRRTLPASVTQTFQASSLTLSSPTRTPMETDGEFVGLLPATFTLQRSRLRVIVP